MMLDIIHFQLIHSDSITILQENNGDNESRYPIITTQFSNALLYRSGHSHLEEHQTYVYRSNFLLKILFVKQLQNIT